MDWAQFFAMGNYGLYVWSAYGLAAVILALNVILPLRQRHTVRKRLREFYRARGQNK